MTHGQRFESAFRSRDNEYIMEFLGKTVAVTVAELTRADDGAAVMSYDNYKKLSIRRSLVVLRPGKGLAHPALIDWNSMPMRFKEAWIAKYGDPNELRKEHLEELRYDTEAMRFFANYQLSDGSYLKSDFQGEYVLNATVLNRLVAMADDQKVVRGRCNMSSRVNWDGIYNECEFLRETYGHTLPKNVARLRDKIRQYKAEGYECLISGKLCNANTQKITPEAGRYIIALKRSRFPRRTNPQIFEEFNRVAIEKAWKPLKSLSSLVNFLGRPEVEVMWKDIEIGEHALNMRMRRQHKTIMPTLRDSIWYGDGTKLNLYYKVLDTTNGGWKLATTSVFEVVDAATETLLGFHIAPRESFESMYEAYRMALDFSGHLPYELVYDQQGGSKRADAQDWFERISTLSRHTAAGNAPSKSIELLFHHFQSQVLGQNFNFSGMNITARTEKSHVDMEFLLANVQQLPTYHEVCAMYENCRKIWNAMPHSKTKQPRMEMYLSQVNEATVVVTESMKDSLYRIKTNKPVRCTNNGITIQINGEKFTYEKVKKDGKTPDIEWTGKHLGVHFYVEYDPHNPAADVKLYSKGDYGYQYVCDAKEYATIHRALIEQDSEERSFIRAMEWDNKVARVRLWLEKVELESEHGVAPEQHGFKTPNIKGVSKKEFDKIFNILLAERAQAAAEKQLPDNASHVYPDSIGKVQKEVSNTTADNASYWSIV